jgi:hypothetical protein
MSAAEINSVMDNLFWWFIFFAILAATLGCFDKD